MRSKILPMLLSVCLWAFSPLFAQKIISLTWSDVVGLTRSQNLDLQMSYQDYRAQKMNHWQAYTEFLPTVNYQFQRTHNIELPEFVFMGQHIKVGTNYNYTHAFQLQYPLFLGGARIANARIQGSLRKSLEAQLRNKEQSVVFQALDAYFRIMLSDELIAVNRRAYEAAKANLNQVQKFYDAGTASQLELMQARTRLSSTLAPLTSAINNKKLAIENLKFILNIDPADSLVVLDTLKQEDYIRNFVSLELPELQKKALENRPEIRIMEEQKKVASGQKWLAASQFLPSVVASASVQHQAQLNDPGVHWEDYTRVKNAVIAVQFPLFQGGKRAIEYQKARIQEKKTALQIEQVKRSILLEVETAYRKFQEAEANLKSLRIAREEAREALRLANLNYQQGLATQVDVLTAQLAYSNNDAQFQQGVYEYNIAQLRLIKAVGLLPMIWKNEN